MAGPRLINSGKPAVEAVATILKTARPITVTGSMGPVDLKPGTIWSGDKMLVDPSASVVYYTIDDRLYECGTGDFIRDEWLNAMAKGVKSAEVWVEVAKTETAVLCGIFAPWYLMLGLSCAKCGLFYVRNKDAVNKAVDVAPTVLKQLERLRAKHPTLFKKLQAQATQEIVSELKQGHGVTPEDVAFFLGRVIHGAAGAPEITLGVLLKITTKVALLVSAAHGPSIVAHAAMSAANRRAEDLRAYLTSLGYTVSLQEAAQIIRELSSDPSALLNLQELSNALRALLPSLQILQKAYGAS